MTVQYDEIIINGDSYSALNKDLTVYSQFLQDKLGINVSNIAWTGSNNDRIVRSTIERVLLAKQSKKRLLVIIGWSFVRRIEVWYYGKSPVVKARIPDKINTDAHKNPSFVSLEVLATLGEITVEQKCLLSDDLFVHKQLTDFYTNVYLLSQFLENNNVDYLFFSAAKNTEIPINSFPYIENLQHVQEVTNNKRIIDLHDFHFKNWASKNDPGAHPVTGHLSTDGHEKFSNLLLEKLHDL